MDQDLKSMLAEIRRAIESDQYEANEWEIGFLESCASMVSRKIPLSDRQDEILERIWKKATRG
jgi:hypothetical protein